MKTRPYALITAYIWLFIFAVIPLSAVIIAGFMSQNSLSLVGMPFTLDNYKNIFSSNYSWILWRSVLLSSKTTVFCLILAYPFAYFISKSKYKSLLILLIMIPFWTNSLIRTYALIAILKFHGILNNLLLQLHIIKEPLELLYTQSAVQYGMVYNLLPFMILPIFNAMEKFDFTLIDAAQDLGAKRLQIFIKVFMPSTTSGVIAGIVLVFLPAMTLFYISDILGGARSMLLGNFIQNQFLVLENWPAGAATSTATTVIFLTVFGVLRKFNKDR
jgi:spermidine/putrescine transport system permease protein